MQTSPNNRPRLYTNAALTVIAGLLGFIALDHTGPMISQANAQPRSQPATHGDDGDDNGRVSAAEQRKVIIAELRNLNSRMDHVDAVLSKPLTVKVTEMPPMQFPADKADKKDDRKPAPKN